MHRFILAIDQGTTGSTALLLDSELKIHAKANVEFPQHFPQPNWVEHNLTEIWDSVCKAISHVMKQSQVSPSDVAAIGITNQRETTCLWHRNEEATPICRAIVWQDRRTAAFCERLKKRGAERSIIRKTGLRLDPYFSGTKLRWMLDNVSGAKALAQNGKVCFGTIESYLLYRLTGEHRTEPSNACRTLLMNLKTCQWDGDLLKLFRIPKQILPEIFPSSVEYGKTKGFLNFPDGIPVTGLAGDQQAALFGQTCFKKGAAKSTYGTGAFVLANIGDKPLYSKHKLLTSVAWQINGKTTYCIEGSAFIAGAAVQWLRDGLKIIQNSSEIEALAGSVKDSDGVVFVPALSGMGAPHWLANAKGMVTGLTRRTTQAHLARATLDGIAFQIRELVEAMGKDLGKRVSPLKVDGGASANDLLMQIQSDLLGVPVVRSEIMETTALGSALQAGLAIGFWKDLKEIEKTWQASKVFEPKMKQAQRRSEVARWDNAIRSLKSTSK